MLIGAGHPLYEAYYGSYRQKDNAALRELLCRSAVLRPSDREKGENEWNSTNRLCFKASILHQLHNYLLCSPDVIRYSMRHGCYHHLYLTHCYQLIYPYFVNVTTFKLFYKSLMNCVIFRNMKRSQLYPRLPGMQTCRYV